MPRILVMDDDRVTLKVIESALAMKGYEIVTATDGNEGLNLIKKLQPDAVITDKMMPTIDGFEVTRRLRREPEFAHIPILILTGKTELEDKLAAFDAGADDYLSKPFEVAELAARMTALLRRSVSSQGKESDVSFQPDLAKLIAVHSLRGGLGCSSIMVNLGVTLAELWHLPTLLLDYAYSTGQLALLLNLPQKRSWADLYKLEKIDIIALASIVKDYNSHLQMIAAPLTPLEAEKVNLPILSQSLRLLRPRYQYILADIPHDFSERSLDVLENADTILLVLAPEMSSIRAAANALDTYSQLGYEEEKIKLVLNWTFAQGGISQKKIEAALQHPIAATIPFAPAHFIKGINKGLPFVQWDVESKLTASMDKLAFILSKEAHKGIPPASPSETWYRIQRRLNATESKSKRPLNRLLSFG